MLQYPRYWVAIGGEVDHTFSRAVFFRVRDRDSLSLWLVGSAADRPEVVYTVEYFGERGLYPHDHNHQPQPRNHSWSQLHGHLADKHGSGDPERLDQYLHWHGHGHGWIGQPEWRR